ncbi:MAG: mechanosensitive ion channel family protein [Ignavibacteriales bacterium]|jgi:Small-conductance mechanosensitive channel|nr:MAG: mechanosensitive ion channel [Ignavibacteriaceae bacterium]MBW7873886.1 mechanosensitive ion channel [Ignavibacteria bacterium]MCZ2143355.1 mechanosensitive ion channel family protein [Ignavibacteriales bacterium]OQY78120.1 MAG: hypothetical protein B6D45_02410 [Ignavibacteriales bacterium UTCHB3]MBV6444236.1 Miniconductance mechanosensitive channel YbdG [Ignavibacteriaceae bacterium]
MKALFDKFLAVDEWVFYFIIIGIAVLVYLFFNWLAFEVRKRLLKKMPSRWLEILLNKRVGRRALLLIPTGVADHYAYLLGEYTVQVRHLLHLWYILLVILILFSVINAIIDIWESSEALNRRPVKGYLQIIKIVIAIWGLVVAAGLLTGQSPWSILTGLSALTAILMLVFRDTILSFVVNIQITSYDLLEKGDWIEVPDFGADGTVADIALHTVKILNSDNSVSIIPTYKLMEVGYKNWRRMSELGARRIMRSVIIDSTSVKIADENLIQTLKNNEITKDFAEEFISNETLSEMKSGEITNLLFFRKYLQWYLKQHQRIRNDLVQVVRLLQSNEAGLPLEVYAFSSETQTLKFEELQSEITEHIVALISLFGLRLFQKSNLEG